MQTKQSNGSCVNASETSDNDNSTDEGCTRERRYRSDKICVIGSSFNNSSCRAAIKQPLGGEGKVGSTPSKQRSRSQVGAFPVADNTEVGNESESYETPTTFPYSASSISSSSSDQIGLQTDGLQTSRLSLLSNLAQAHAHAHEQRKAPPPLKESLLNQQICVGASAAQLTAIVGLPLLVPPLNPLLLPQSSLDGQLQLALIAQNWTGFPLEIPLKVFSPPLSLLGQLQPASIAPLTRSELVRQLQTPAPQAPSWPSQTYQLLAEMQQASLAQYLTGTRLVPQVPARSLQQSQFQSSHLSPAHSASTLSGEYFLQQLSASQNRPFFPYRSSSSIPSQTLQVQESNMIKDQITALLLSQQQAGGANTTTPGMIPYLANQTDLFPRSLAANANLELNIRNSIQGTPAMATTTEVSAFHHSLPNPTFSNNYDMGFYSSGETSSEVARRGHFHVQSRTREKRWMIRYEELKQFQQVNCIPFSCVNGRLILLFFFVAHSYVSSLDKSEETWALSGASWLCRKSQAFLVGDEPTGPVSNA